MSVRDDRCIVRGHDANPRVGESFPFDQSSTKSKESRSGAVPVALSKSLAARLDRDVAPRLRKASRGRRRARYASGDDERRAESPVGISRRGRYTGQPRTPLHECSDAATACCPSPRAASPYAVDELSRTRAHGHQHARDGRLRGLSAALTVTKGKVKAFRRGGGVGEKVERALPTPRVLRFKTHLKGRLSL